MAKILHIITRLDRGGSAVNTLLTCQGLSEKYEIILVCGLSLESKMTRWETETVEQGIREAGERGATVHMLRPLVRKINPLADVRALRALVELMKRERPDIVHTHTSKAGLLGRWAAKIARVPRIIHTPHGHVFYGHFGPLVSKVFFYLEKWTAPMTHRVIALTEAERRDYISFSLFPPEKIATIHSGVDIHRFKNIHLNPEEKKAALGLDPLKPVVGSIGWLLPIKGPMHLLKAMERVWESYPDTTLVYVGKGGLEEDLRKESLRMGATERVKFLGWRDDVPEIMQILDVLVLPSFNEGMGRVLVEAMAAGRPVVASRVGGILDLVKDGENGFLVEPGDVEGLSSAIRELIGDPGLRGKMGRVGKGVAEEYSVEAMVQKIDALYVSLLTSERS